MNFITTWPYLKEYERKYYQNTEERLSEYLENYYQRRVSLLNSARVALYLGLKHYNFSSDRENHILVHKYMSSCVLNVLNENSFPVRKIDEQTKAVLIFHQWGYPQKMDEVMSYAKDKGLLVIEDCAHSFNSKYKNKIIGTFGDFSIFSFPKVLPSFTGGMILSGNNQLMEEIKQYKKDKGRLFTKIFQKFSFQIIKKHYINNKIFGEYDLFAATNSKYASLVKIDSQALKLLPSSQKFFEECLDIRKNNFNYLKENINPSLYKNEIEADCDVCPYAVPIFASDGLLEKIKNKLREKNILVDILHFDINRNIFFPNYQKCIPLPCHHLLKAEDLKTMIDTINEAII